MWLQPPPNKFDELRDQVIEETKAVHSERPHDPWACRFPMRCQLARHIENFRRDIGRQLH